MIDYVEDWIAEYPDEFEEEGTEAKIRRIHQEDAFKYNLSVDELEEEER